MKMRHQEFEQITAEVFAKNTSRTDMALALFILCDYPEAKSICDSLAWDLRRENWEWIASSELSEVALIISALYRYTPHTVDGACMASLAKKMVASEANISGPYCNNTGEVDIFTNAAVALLFSIFASPLSGVVAFLSPYLKADSQSEYLSLIFTEQAKNKGRRKLVLSMKHFWDTYIPQQTRAAAPPDRIANQIRVDIQKFETHLRTPALAMWKSIVAADSQKEITSLSSQFADSLMQRPAIVTNDLCSQLGKANYFTWIAYTAYDNFIDDEADPKHLPVANMAMRKAVKIYKDIIKPDTLSDVLVEKYFDGMDAANAWELEKCRFTVNSGRITIKKPPYYGARTVLAKRAAAHVLGPMIITSLYPGITQKQCSLVQRGLFQFLIARQLNDDLHDWKADFKQGHISFVVGFLLSHANILPGEYDLQVLTNRMQDYFWESGIEEISRLVRTHVEHSRQSLMETHLFADDSPFFTDILGYIDSVASASIATHADRKNFLYKYTNDI